VLQVLVLPLLRQLVLLLAESQQAELVLEQLPVEPLEQQQQDAE
jgi:hypothetical protein